MGYCAFHPKNRNKIDLDPEKGKISIKPLIVKKQTKSNEIHAFSCSMDLLQYGLCGEDVRSEREVEFKKGKKQKDLKLRFCLHYELVCYLR